MSKITGIDLYCDDSEASTIARKWFDDNDVPYDLRYYANEQVHPKELVLSPMRTWTWAEGPFNVTHFPFVTYIDVGTGDPRRWPIHFMTGPDFTPILDLVRVI